MKTSQHMSTGQSMAMTPQLLQSIRLLQLTGLELEQEVQMALAGNVMLEEGEEESAPAETGEAAAAESTEAPVTGCDEQALSRVEADFDWSSADSWSGGEPADEEGESLEARRAAPGSHDIRVRAAEQLACMRLSLREQQLATVLLEAIDDNGYLETSLAELAAALPEQLDADEAELEAVLRRVQQVEPTGFGARNLVECLLLQLRVLPASTPGHDLAVFLVSGCLSELGGGDLKSIAEALQLSLAEMRVAVALVLSLDPKPGACHGIEAEAAIPDVVVTGSRGSWKVMLNERRLPRVRVNHHYERLLNDSSPHRALREQLQEARWLVRGLEMRHETLLRTARAVFERQTGFLERGEEGLLSLTLREIADHIGMHESTVCRISNGKFVQTPWGVYELKDFFPSQIAGSAVETSGTAVKAMIRRIVDTERHAAPLCDGAIAAILLRKGIKVARRTVAKYREAMQIAPAPLRRMPTLSRAALRMAG